VRRPLPVPPPTVPRRHRGAVALLVVAGLAVATTACSPQRPTAAAEGADGTTTLTVAEPVHSLGYLPLYVAQAEGFFAEEGLDVEVVTLQGGSAHTNAVLTGEAWAFIGGPEHNALAAARASGDAQLRAIGNVVNRGNVYLVAAAGAEVPDDLAGALRGATVATGAYGGTPNSITRYLMAESDLGEEDVTLVESADASAVLSIVEQGRADLAVVAEPVLGQGIAQGIWGEPVYNVPQELGDYAYSTLNVLQSSVEEDPATAAAFTRAMATALALVEDDPEAAEEVAAAEFPTLDPAVLAETLERSYADEIWEFDGRVSEESVETALGVVRASGVLDDAADPVTFDELVDMRFVDDLDDGA